MNTEGQNLVSLWLKILEMLTDTEVTEAPRADKITYYAPYKSSEFHPEQHFGHRNFNKVGPKCLKHGLNNRVVKRKRFLSN